MLFYQSGRIDIKARVSKQLSLCEGDVIDVASHKGEYLLYVRHRRCDIVGSHEATVHASNKYRRTSNNLRTYSKQLTNAVYEIAGCDKASPLRLPAGEPVNIEGIGIAIPLITRNPL